MGSDEGPADVQIADSKFKRQNATRGLASRPLSLLSAPREQGAEKEKTSFAMLRTTEEIKTRQTAEETSAVESS